MFVLGIKRFPTQIVGTLSDHTDQQPMHTMNSSNVDSLGKEDAWIVVEDEEPELEGMTLAADRESGDIVSLSTRSCTNEQRRGSMPSLEAYPHLRVVDIHNYRIMTTLHESICHLPVLQKLTISRCDFLKKLPASIGNLENLVEVSPALTQFC